MGEDKKGLTDEVTDLAITCINASPVVIPAHSVCVITGQKRVSVAVWWKPLTWGRTELVPVVVEATVGVDWGKAVEG